MALVTGILGTCDPQQIEKALASTNIDMSKVRVVTKDAPSEAHENSIIDFVFVAESQSVNDFSDGMTHGTGIMSDSGGTGVPGITGNRPDVRSFVHGGGLNYLAGFPIPSDHLDNLNTAVSEGRCVITYDVTGDPAPIADAFKAAGLRAVRTF